MSDDLRRPINRTLTIAAHGFDDVVNGSIGFDVVSVQQLERAIRLMVSGGGFCELDISPEQARIVAGWLFRAAANIEASTGAGA